jgi:hypothetical protein
MSFLCRKTIAIHVSIKAANKCINHVGKLISKACDMNYSSTEVYLRFTMDKYIDIKLFLQLHHTTNFTLDSFDILLLCNPAISNHLYIYFWRLQH